MKILLLSIQTLLRFRLYTIINIVGLALSMASSILIFRYIYSEITTDHFIQDIDRVCYTVREDEITHQVQLEGFLPEYGYESELLNDPAFEIRSVLFQRSNDQIIVNDKMYNVATLATDSNYLKIINLPIKRSTTHRLFHNPTDAIISESLSKQIFGEEDPVGKSVKTSSGEIVNIVGIMGKPKTRFSMPFDIMFSYETTNLPQLMSPSVLVRLHKGNSSEQVNRKYPDFHKYSRSKNRVRFNLYPIENLYFDQHIITFQKNRLQGNYTHMLILSAIAILIIIIGLFNFINIYTVLILKRAREFGMKKVFGANSRQMAIQLYVENFCMTALALFISWIFIELGMVAANTLLSIRVYSVLTFDLSVSLGILFILPLITSVYPFLQYNYSNPIVSLQKISRGGYSTISRNIFLCLQYVFTLLLIIISIYSIRQLNFMLNTDPGYSSDNIIRVARINTPAGNNMELWNKFNLTQVLVEKGMKENSSFIEYYSFHPGPITDKESTSTYARISNGEWKQVHAEASTRSYFDILNIKVTEGRLWNDSIDSELDMSLIINETAKKELGITDITKTILTTNTVLYYSSLMEEWPAPRYKIIGVIKDYQNKHLSKSPDPMIFFNYKGGPFYGLLVKYKPDKKQEVIHFLQKIYNENCGDEFSYTFLKDDIQTLYKADAQLVKIASLFALIAILISSLGLFSLSLFDIQQRFHEIAIRKVNGATTLTVIKLLFFKYYKLQGLAFLIAAPLSWLIITLYMEDFVHKAPVSWWIFVVAALLTGGISYCTLIWQIYKAARTNPAEIIRSE